MPQQIDIVANLLMKVDGAESGLKRLQNSLSGLKLPKGLDSDLKKSMSNLEGLFATYRKQIEKGFDTKSDVSAFTKTAKSVNAEYDRITRTLDKLNNTNVTFNIKSDSIKKVEQDLDNIIKKRDQLSTDTQNSIAVDLANIQKAGSRSTKVQDYSNMLGVAIDKGQWQEALRLAQLLKTQFEGLSDKTKQAFASMSNGKSATAALDDIIEACRKGGEGFDKLEKEGKEAAELLASLQAKDLEQIEKALAKMGGEWQESTNGAKALNGEMTELARSTQSMSQQLGDLQQSTQYFFSLRNMINLLKRGISDAVQTVKELDAAMTETAVVTDFSVGDMWAKLPEYTANANKLGATIQDMYESTTLYYQQGLNTEQSMAIAAETMKMARIAGLEAKDATDMMTAALRGFNMELNETSATRINDVYSNLAAKTASDTEEIGKAMQRTASIAHSAGMSFEGTAAFLAQAVETTREPAENIGTAMKTIVARFQEMKKNPLEITEVDGEEVSYNKVDAALQSIGVSLKDANGQFRELDKVFLDISKKWNSLSQTQQRYIATIAAGSRQQSRFIAMMGDYDRTVELMSYANDSAGASQEQFNKTLDSLEAKLNKFQNAWDQFLMGIMNDSWVKGVVDAGTTILKTVNSIIDALSFGGKAKGLKSLLSIGTAGVALKAGGNLINKLIGGVGGFIDPASSFGKGFWGAGKTTQEGTPATGLAGKITTPIVAKLNELIAVTKGNKDRSLPKTTSTLDQYKNASAMLRNTKSLNMGDISTIFSGLSDEHAYAAYKNTPGTADAMKQAALGWLGSKKMPADAQKTGQQLMNSIFKGMSKKEISIKDGIKLIGQPQKWGEYFGTDVAWNLSNSLSKELTNQAHTIALEKLGWDPEKFKAGSKELADYLNSPFSGQAKEDYIKYFKEAKEQLSLKDSLDNISVEQTKYQNFANTIGNLGSKFSSAGMSLQMFGTQLGQLSPALEGVGTLIARIGGMLSTFGMGVSGIGSIVTGVGKRIAAGQAAVKYGSAAMAQAVTSGAMAAESTVAATGTSAASAFVSGFTGGMSAGPIAAIVAAVLVGGIAIAKGIADKKAREAGEEVRENFEQGFTEANKKIDSITEYRDRFNELSQGVDQFGHNINLTDEEFDEYLTISRELQELSPSLISGYNAEGQAILRKGAALDEVIDKLKEERDLSLQDYITDDSISKLIGEYNTSDAYKNHNTIKMGDSGMGDAFSSEKSGISKALKEAEIEWSDFSQILDELGIGSAESISDLSNRQLSMISAHYTDILNKIKEFNPQIEEEAEDGLKEAFAETNNALEDILTEGAPVVDALRQWMGQEKLDAVGLGLSEEFVSGFNSGLDGLMVEGLTNNWKPEEYKAQLRDYANEWEHLAGPTSTYANILSEADQIQQDYLDHIGEDGAIENYESNVEGLATQLESLAEQYKGTGKAGEVFAEQCQQQANNLRNYATEGVISLSEALNTLSDEFTSARGAQERFQKATEGGDYYTAAEGYKSIIDTVLDDKNKAGDGSLTFWAGADELLGQEFVDNSTYDEVINQIEKIQDCFADGADGVIAFNDLLTENADKLEGLGHVGENGFEFDLQNEDLEEYAKVLGMSEDALAALIDKARQWTPIDLGNPGEIRKAIEGSEYSMAGTSTRGESLVYTSESQFRTEARQQGIRGDDYTKTKEDAEARGVRFLNVENLTAKKGDGLYADQVLENIGLKGQDKTVENAVAAFTKMGLDLEDTKQVLMSDGIKLADGEEATAENIEKAYNEQAYAMENPTVAGIASDASTLVSNTSAMLAAMGILTDDAKKEIDQATSDETTQGYIDNLNNASNLGERNQARTTMEDKVSEYNALASKLVESGRSETDPYVQKLRTAAEALQTELDAEAKNWNDKAVVANQYLKDNNIIPQSATQEEQTAIQMHAVDIQSAIESGDANTVVETLKQIETEGNLSIETMIALGQSVSNLGAVDSSTILHFISEYYEKLKLAREESNKPFEIQTKYTGEKLEDHVSKVKEFTTQEYAFLIRTDVTGDEKVSTLINSINQEFGNGDQETKTILIDAVAKTASGDKEDAHTILTEAFGEDKAETVEKKIDVLCDGSVANKDEVTKALEGELKEVPLNVKTKANVDVDASIESLKTSGGTVNYSTKVDTAGLDSAKKSAAEGAKLPLTIEDKASKDIRAIRSQAGKKVSFDVEPNFTGVWHKTLTITKSGSSEHDARGRNYSIPVPPSLSFGSAAQGMNIPKKKQSGGSNVTALVGEEGYEVGYIPSEGRSVIFGANGPEMTSFPSDTVIYPHKQSKEILRRGKGDHKSLGSFKDGKDSISSGGLLTNISRGSSSSSAADKIVDAAKKTGDKLSKTASDTAKAVNRVLVWWDNAGRRSDALQRQADKNQKTYEKYLKDIQATLKTTGTDGGGNKFIATTQKAIVEYERQFNRAVSELNSLDKGAAAKTSKGRKKQYKNGADNIVQVSYKKGKKQKTAYMNTAGYIYYDTASGSYQINENALKGIKNADKRKAFYDAAQKELNDRISKKNAAEDNIEKAREALEKFGEELYNTFFAWEVELTKIWNITQQIETTEAKISRAKSYQELLNARLANGITTADQSSQDTFDAFKLGIEEERKNIQLNIKSLSQQREDLQRLLDSQDERKTLEAVQDKLVKNVTGEEKLNTTEETGYKQYAKELESTIDTQLKAWKYLNIQQFSDGTVEIDFDTKDFETDKLNATMTSEQGKAIQDYVKSLVDSNKELNNIYNTITTKMTEMNQSLSTLQDQWVGYANELWQISEEEQKKEVDNLKKLNDSLTNSLKNLLDDVKRKLDQRRKQEDNAKTEQDIAQKQQRLAALRADTSGGHQVEIAQLQSEIADAQQNYQRTLEDQLLDNLQQQADVAAEQRERQITLQEELITAVNNASLVNQWMNDPVTYKDAIFEAYKTANDFDEKPQALQEDLIRKFEVMFEGLKNNQAEQEEVNKVIEELEKERADTSEKLAGLTDITGTLNLIKESIDSIKLSNGVKLEKQEDDAVGGSTDTLLQTIVDSQKQPAPNTNNNNNNNTTSKLDAYKNKVAAAASNKKMGANEFKSVVAYAQAAGVSMTQMGKDLAKTSGLTWKQVVKAAKKAGYSKNTVTNWWGGVSKKSKAAIADWSKYATGGLANYTGPAWLDGTPSKPELVLNATDTRNFLALRDVLSKAMGSANTVTNSYGGNATYEININVDKIEKDYDVDRVAERVKKIIVKDSGYRNVTQVRNFR